MAQLKSPISSFLVPNTDTIADSTKKSLYDEMSYLYVQKFAQLRPEKVAYQNRVSHFFLPTQENEFNPPGRDVFFSDLDFQVKKDPTVPALMVMISTGDAYIEAIEKNK